MDHIRNPRNRGLLDPSDGRARDLNPLCGDWVEVSLRLGRGAESIEAVGFDGVGCSVSQAAASMLLERAAGARAADVRAMSDGEVYALLGIELNANRKKCAQVSLRVLKAALSTAEAGQPSHP